MRVYNILILVFSIVLISGCAKKLEISTIDVERQKLNLSISEVKFHQVQFIVLTEENKDMLNGTAMIALTPSAYENLSKNTVILRESLREAQKIIQHYKDYYESK